MDECGAWDERSLVEDVRCVCVWLRAAWVEMGGSVDERIGFGLH